MNFNDVGGIKTNPNGKNTKLSKYSHKISIVDSESLSAYSKKVICQACSIMDSQQVFMVRSNSPMEDSNWHCPKCGNVMVRKGRSVKYSDPEVAPGEVSIEAVNDLLDPTNQPRMKSITKVRKPNTYEDPQYVRGPGYTQANQRRVYGSASEALKLKS